MKATARCTLFTVMLMLLAGCATVDTRWQQARSSDTVRAYERFLKRHPDSEHAVTAREKIESLGWQRAKKSNTAYAYEAFLRKHPTGQFSPKAIAELETFARIVPSMLDPIPYQSWGNDGWKYDYTVTFSETRGVSAKVEWLKRVYWDRRGAQWSTGGGRGTGGFKKIIPIRVRGKNRYSSWVRGTVNPDLRGGTVTVRFSGHDENGHAFSGSISSKLAWPKQ